MLFIIAYLVLLKSLWRRGIHGLRFVAFGPTMWKLLNLIDFKFILNSKFMLMQEALIIFQSFFEERNEFTH